MQLFKVRTSVSMMRACCDMVRTFANEIVDQQCPSKKPVAKKMRVVAKKRPQVRAIMDAFISVITICHSSLYSSTTWRNPINLVWLRAGKNIKRVLQVCMLAVSRANGWIISMPNLSIANQRPTQKKSSALPQDDLKPHCYSRCHITYYANAR